MSATGHKRPHILLSFAHRGEAKAFLQEFKWQSIKEDLYFFDDEENPLSLLITGEGRDLVLVKLSSTLAFLQERFPEDQLTVFNLGVCGHLKGHPQQFEKEQVVSAATCYSDKGLQSKDMEFKSFPTNQIPNISFEQGDIVSTSMRVLDPEIANHLSNFAPLVDREAWATGFVCNQHQISFSSLKVISDFADGDICSRVKDETDRWSDLLLRAFFKWSENTQIDETSDEGLWPELNNNLHITVSQERRLKNLLKALQLKGKSKDDILSATSFEKVVAEDIRPKEKTKVFLESLADYLNPLDKKLKEELSNITAQLSEAGFSVRFDQGHENEVIHLTGSLEKETQINNMITALESFDFNKFRQLLRGEDK